MNDDDYMKLFLAANPWERIKLMAKYRRTDFVFLILGLILIGLANYQVFLIGQVLGWW